MARIDIVSPLTQKLLQDGFAPLIFTLAELPTPDVPLSVDQVQSWPVLIIERLPDAVVAVDRYGVVDLHGPSLSLHAWHIVLEAEFRGMDADDHQSALPVLRLPGPQVRQGATPIDAREGPEIDQNDLAAQILRIQGLGIQPFDCTPEGRHLLLAQPIDGSRHPHWSGQGDKATQ